MRHTRLVYCSHDCVLSSHDLLFISFRMTKDLKHLIYYCFNTGPVGSGPGLLLSSTTPHQSDFPPILYSKDTFFILLLFSHHSGLPHTCAGDDKGGRLGQYLLSFRLPLLAPALTMSLSAGCHTTSVDVPPLRRIYICPFCCKSYTTTNSHETQ